MWFQDIFWHLVAAGNLVKSKSVQVYIKCLFVILKCARNKCAYITWYRNTYLILGYGRMLPLHDVALDDGERPWRRAKSCQYAFAESDSHTIKTHSWQALVCDEYVWICHRCDNYARIVHTRDKWVHVYHAYVFAACDKFVRICHICEGFARILCTRVTDKN